MSKDISALQILEFLVPRIGTTTSWFEGWDPAATVRTAMPLGTPDRRALAAMRLLKRHGLIEGCCCGCRGDFEITRKGLEYVAEVTGKDMSESLALFAS